jgi:hypothetical protein
MAADKVPGTEAAAVPRSNGRLYWPPQAHVLERNEKVDGKSEDQANTDIVEPSRTELTVLRVCEAKYVDLEGL